MNRLYYKYSDYLKDKFGEKVYKLPISLPLTCPNRDGTKGVGGCIYCSEEGGSHENLSNTLSIKEQLETNKEYIGKRYGARKFIAYFQSFTNTYLSLEEFKKNIEEVGQVEDIVGISISTRPDCLSDEILDYLESIKDRYFINIELGLQSVNNHTLIKINRGHLLTDFLDAVFRIKKRDLSICVHLILDLPWDDRIDVIEAANLMSLLKIDEIKLHSLYITVGTEIERMYRNNELILKTEEEYIELVIEFLTRLSPGIAIQRLLSRAPEDKVLASNWGRSWWIIQDKILEEMEKRGLYQGKICKFK